MINLNETFLGRKAMNLFTYVSTHKVEIVIILIKNTILSFIRSNTIVCLAMPTTSYIVIYKMYRLLANNERSINRYSALHI